MKSIELQPNSCKIKGSGLFIKGMILPVILLLTGCAMVGPDYKGVDQKTPAAWHTELQGGLVAGRMDPEALALWWKTLHDPELQSLEQRAVEGNKDLQAAKARVLEARARRGISSAGLFPSLNASASAVNKRTSLNNGGTGVENTIYKAGFDAGWELDLFGGLRRSEEAAEADLQASREDLHDVLVTLTAEVALNYVEVRTYQARLTASEINLKAQQESYDLNLSSYHAGLINQFAVEQAAYGLEQTRSQIPSLQTGLEAAKNRLAVLLGVAPGSIHKELEKKKAIPAIPVRMTVGIPAQMLRLRPDVRRAERNLAAQTARIGVATADLYPKFTLSGTIGLESIPSSELFKSESRAWNYGPGISWNIFDAGAVRRNIEVQNARQKQALIAYESTVLKAQEEVENALTAYSKEQVRLQSLARATAAANRAYFLARDQYKAGLVDFTTVLDSQRSLQSLEDELAVSQGTVTSNMIRLYKALGGGWMPEDKILKAETGKRKTEN
jgi:NodT family efflux transporter outer membrane factor (OMF) lipoprotein